MPHHIQYEYTVRAGPRARRIVSISAHPYVRVSAPMAVVLYAVLAIVLAILVLLTAIICTSDSSPTKHKDKLDPPVLVDLPDIVAPRRRHVPERGIGAAL